MTNLKTHKRCSSSLSKQLILKPPQHSTVSLLDLLWSIQSISTTKQGAIHHYIMEYISADVEM